MVPAMDTLDRVVAARRAGRAWAPEDLEAVGSAIERFVAGATFEDAIDLPKNWRELARRRAVQEVAATLAGGRADKGRTAKSIGHAAAREIHLRAKRYAGSAYIHDRKRGAAASQANQPLFRLLEENGGEVPAANTIRKMPRGAIT